MSINETGRSADRHVSGPSIPTVEYREILQIWRKGVDGGMGYAVGVDTDGINGLAGEIGTLSHAARDNGEIAVYRDAEGHRIAVGDVNGPFAVDVDAEDEPDLYA